MKGLHRHSQRGAVTLMGALFIIITLVVMIQAINRMAASSITGTVAQNDTIEALFIAETGIEYASYLYANGTACADIHTTVGTTDSGNGSFDITASALNGSDCAVTVQARASSVGASAPGTAQRTVDALLRLGSASAWAVGSGGTILQWDGANWIAAVSGVTQDLNAVHCASANDCWAVGNAGVIRYWNGSNWTGQTSGTTNTLHAISCEPSNPNNCYASGGFLFLLISRGVIQHWNGSTWTSAYDTGIQFGAGDLQLLDLACPSGVCYASMANGAILRYTGSWNDDSSGTSGSMNGIDCWSDDDCWAVGDVSGTSWNLNERDSGGWNPQTVSVGNQANQNLNTISCVDGSDCWAGGNDDGSRYVFGHWDGSGWSAVTLTNGSQNEDVNSIHCIATDDCWAVGNTRNGWNILHYDGTGWTYTGATAANPVDLHGVYVAGSGGGGSGGAVSLVRWQEQISN